MICCFLHQLLVKLPEMSPNMADLEGNSPAHLAAAEGHLDCLRLLVYCNNEPGDVITARNNKVRPIYENNIIECVHCLMKTNNILHA